MLFYSILFVVEVGLMVKYIRKGPFMDVAETRAPGRPGHEHRPGCAPMTAMCPVRPTQPPAE